MQIPTPKIPIPLITHYSSLITKNMLIAQEKRKTNIAEYILYMWQVEDLIRAHDFSIDLIESNLISQYSQPSKVKNDIRDWFANLMLMMYREGIRVKGHLSFLNTLVTDMNDMHIRLLKNENERTYRETYQRAASNINEFRKKMANNETTDIETCLNALYGMLILRLKKQSISKDTEIAMATFSRLLAQLSHKFLQAERGEREI
jgi:flagellin-specific chaperone FliS